jgi:hypothetical protein
VLRQSSLDDRWRELLILRTGWLCKSGYEFAQHSRLAARAGMTRDEIERIKVSPVSAHWSHQERTLLASADELHSNYFIGVAETPVTDAMASAEKMRVAIAARPFDITTATIRVSASLAWRVMIRYRRKMPPVSGECAVGCRPARVAPPKRTVSA